MKTMWRITGEELASCSCAWGCPCQFNARPTQGFCQAIVAVRIDAGHYGDTRLDGLTFASLYALPGAPHEGNGTMLLIHDERATNEQQAAIKSITYGEDGGMPWEIFSAICPHKMEPVISRIAFQTDREQRRASLQVPGLAEARVTPISNPVTGELHRARIVLPEGFEFKEAEMGNTVVMKASASAPLSFTHENCYAQLAAADWTNAG